MRAASRELTFPAISASVGPCFAVIPSFGKGSPCQPPSSASMVTPSFPGNAAQDIEVAGSANDTMLAGSFLSRPDYKAQAKWESTG